MGFLPNDWPTLNNQFLKEREIPMRYLIISYDDYFNIPYIRFYEETLRKEGHTYDIVLWKRSGKSCGLPNAYEFGGKDHSAKVRKIVPFLRWRKFTLDILKQNHYDRLIILTTMPGILLADHLLGEYKGKYWFDIRDFTYENVFFYKGLVAKLVHGSWATSISSPAFQSFLPNSPRIHLTHNITNEDAAVGHCPLDVTYRPMKIGYVGGIQFVEQNQMLLKQFAHNPDFILKYAGRPHLGCDLQPFCKEQGIKNAEFLPAFTNDQKPGIYQDIHLINSIYGNDNQVVRLLLPNRLYDCVLFKKPILVSKGTYLAEVVARYNLGIAVDPAVDDVAQEIETYLKNFNHQAFDAGCEAFLKVVATEKAAYDLALAKFCTKSE